MGLLKEPRERSVAPAPSDLGDERVLLRFALDALLDKREYRGAGLHRVVVLVFCRCQAMLGDESVTSAEDKDHCVGLLHERKQRVFGRIRTGGAGLRHQCSEPEALDRLANHLALRLEAAHH